MADLTIYLGNKNYASWSLRAWLALKQTGAPFEEVVIPLDRPATKEEIRRVTPSARVPALHHGAIRVWDSLAICEHLAEAFPRAGLWPAEPAARAVARSISAEMHAGFAELRRSLPMDLRAQHRMPERVARAQADIERVVAIWRDCRERFGSRAVHGAGDLLFGGFCIADAMFAPVVSRFRTYGVSLDATCAAYVEALWSRPAMQEWAAAAEAEPWSADLFGGGGSAP